MEMCGAMEAYKKSRTAKRAKTELSAGNDTLEAYKTLLYETKISSNANQAERIAKKKQLHDAVKSLLPENLYHFRPVTTKSLDAFSHGRIYFNTPEKFNDPYDCLPYINMEIVEGFCKSIDINNEISLAQSMRDGTYRENINQPLGIRTYLNGLAVFVSQMDGVEFQQRIKTLQAATQENIHAYLLNKSKGVRIGLVDAFKKDIHIACLSANIYSMLMWSHYADSHKGFVLEYDPLKFFTYNNCKNCTEFEKCEYIHLIDIFPVLYENERYDITEYAVEALHRQCFYSESENVPFTVGDTLFTMKVLMQKNPVWAYEKEWRLR